jgi:hypothetical protein
VATIRGTAGRDRLFGSGGADTIWALAGDDIANGAGGSDTLSGGGDDDLLQGEADLDLFLVNGAFEGAASAVWRNRGDGALADAGQRLGADLGLNGDLGDIDGDGDLDAFVVDARYYSGFDGLPVGAAKVYLNDGRGRFADSGQLLGEYTMGVQSQGVALGDIDGDRDIDAVVAGGLTETRVWLNQGGAQGGEEGRFAEGAPIPNEDQKLNAMLGDLDGDGDLDLVLTALYSPTLVLLNQGGAQGGVQGAFLDSGQRLGERGTNLALADLDRDGDLDVCVNRVEGRDTDRVASGIWLNDSRGVFTDSRVRIVGDTNRVLAGDLDGVGGNDLIQGGAGDDRINGRPGDDRLYGDAGADTVVGGLGDDRIWGGDEADSLFGDQGSDRLRGGDGDDVLWGDRSGAPGGDDHLLGEAGKDIFHGGDGNDRLDGGSGADRLEGGRGRDVTTGGAGADLFRFSAAGTTRGTAQADVVSDFSRAQGDRIDLRPTEVSRFVGYDAAPSTGEVGFWQQDGDTIVTFNDDGRLHDIVLEGVSLGMSARDFLL